MNLKTAAFVTLVAFALSMPFGAAQAFQVYTPDQLENGIGVRGGLGFKDAFPEETQGFKTEFNVSSGARDSSSIFGGQRSEFNNWYGRPDGGGRNFGDDRTSNNQNCASADSQVGMLNAFGSGTGGVYPCQRFR